LLSSTSTGLPSQNSSLPELSLPKASHGRAPLCGQW
jgi:hypothetical protein